MSAMAMGVSSAATGLREDSSGSADAATAPEGYMVCGEPLSKTRDSSSACKGRMKDQHEQIFSMPRYLTVFVFVIQERTPLDAFTAASILNTQARKRSVSPISGNLF